MRDHNLPIWNGEWGPVYSSPTEPNWKETNSTRLKVVKTQLENYTRIQCGWSLWTWKDIGYQGPFPSQERNLRIRNGIYITFLKMEYPLVPISRQKGAFRD